MSILRITEIILDAVSTYEGPYTELWKKMKVVERAGIPNPVFPQSLNM